LVVAEVARDAVLVGSALGGSIAGSTEAAGAAYCPRVIALGLAAFARIMSGARARWVGCQPDVRQRVYFANHTSHMDAIVIWAVLPPEVRQLTRPVAARDYWNAGRVRRYLATREFHAVLIDRAITGVHQNPVDELANAMGTRHSLIFFPEGQRGTEPEPRAFRSGLFRLAERMPQVDLIPVYLTNMERVMPRGALVPVPLQSDVIFGAPIRLSEGEGKRAFLDRARDAVASLRPR
jgi:1-acyl-sn-glycerol-3-phosphate acyltransferase